MDNLLDKRVLITGGLGFIGSNLARRLVEQGAKVTLVDSLIPEYGGNIFNLTGIEDRVKINISDVRDEHSIYSLVQGQDYLFNLAGQTSHWDSMKDPFTDLEINAKAQLYILEACRKYNPHIKIVFASTRQVYGVPKYLPVDEKHPLCPVDINGVNKLAGEWFHCLYNNVYGISACVLRLTNTIGPGMRIKDARQTFVGIWIRHLVEGKPFEVWGGQQLRDFTYVDDAVDAFLMVAADSGTNGRVFNLGGERPISLKELADMLVELNGPNKTKYIVKDFPETHKRIDIGDFYADYGLIQKILGWTPKVSLKDALRETLVYYKQHIDKYI
jgi:nucleoside-diphosphate-sugar epimerase